MASAEWSWPLVIALIAAPLTLLWFYFGSKGKKRNLPPGPPSWPLIGHLPMLMDSSRPNHQVLNELAKTYGPVVSLKVGMLNLVVVSGLETVMEVLKEKDHLFANRPDRLVVVNYLGYGSVNVSMGQPGEGRTFLRKLMVSELLASKKLHDFQAVRAAELDALIYHCFQASLNKEGVKVHKQLSSMAVSIMSQLSFGKKDPKTQKEWVDVLPEMTECFTLPLLESFHPGLKWLDTLTGNRKKMQQVFKRVDRILQDVLDHHTKELDALSLKELEDYEPKDIMDIILLQRNGENSKFITDSAVKAVGVDLISAGSDTVSATMEWVMTELLINPHVMKRAQQELDSVVGKERFITEEDDVENLPFLAAILKETFRLHCVVPMLVPHSNRVDCKIGGYDIPANSFVNLNVYGLSRNPSIWNDPLRWNPDRFLSGSMAAVDVKGGYPQLLPFGRGRRSCPGIAFAHNVMYIVLARLIHSFDWSLPEGLTANKMDMSEHSGLVASKLKELVAVPKPRLAPQLYKSL